MSVCTENTLYVRFRYDKHEDNNKYFFPTNLSHSMWTVINLYNLIPHYKLHIQYLHLHH